MSRREGPVALALGDADLVRALALGGLRCGLFARPRAPARWSRTVVHRVAWHDPWREPHLAVDAVERFARQLNEPPVLFPQGDGELLLLSRHRDRLERCCRLLLADADTIEALADKARFAALAAELGLPVPPSQLLDPRRERPEDLELELPVVLKPIVRDDERWSVVEPAAKALHVADRAALAALWPRLEAAGVAVLAQRVVPGPESAIESFHAYIAADGAFVAGFTGRKLRTWPPRYGHSTAVQITDTADVVALGREVLERLAVRGVAKVDFKRAPDGRLHLLEVNPRFTLWHHPAALAGLNIPALVHADLTGRPRPSTGPARPGVGWCLPLSDLRTARAQDVGLRDWLRFFRRCEARSGLSARDPLVFFPGVVWNRIARQAAQR